MPKFTKGKWSYSTYLTRGDVTLIRLEADGKKLGILFELEEENEANAMLIACAPELYELLKEELIPTSDYGGTLSFAREAKIRKVIDYIDGKKVEHE